MARLSFRRREALHRALVQAEGLDLVQTFLRGRRARRRRDPQPGAVTVVIASWNSNQFLETTLAAVNHFSDRPTTVIVVDNHSDASPLPVARRYGAQLIRLPFNLRHSFALDVGFLSARTEYVMALDVDAFPYSRDWMPTFLKPLTCGYGVVGCEWWRPYAHPCCLAMSTAEFVAGRHSFRPRLPVETGGWDTGEGISRRIGPDRLKIVPRTGSLSGIGYFTASYGDVLYHNCYATRHLHLARPDLDALDGAESPADLSEMGITRQTSLDWWNEAVARFGPGTWHGWP
jgi:hypothetical protein